MKRTYYILWYRLDGADRYLIWYQTESPDDVDRDGVVLEEGRIPVFSDIGRLRAFADAHGISLEEESPLLHDLDAAQTWLRMPRKTTILCDKFLSAWNLFADIGRSINDADFEPHRDRTRKIYSKLLYGNNLPALTPPGEEYFPLWSKSEVGIIYNILGYGLVMFRRHVQEKE